MGEIGRYYLLFFLICIGFVLPGLAKADSGAWTQSVPIATAKQERQIFGGCAFKSELVFYAAQQKLYAHGNSAKLLAYLRENMSEAEFAINEQFMQWIGEWVDSHAYQSAHEYSSALFNECVANSYQKFQVRPSDQAGDMIRRFYDELDNAEERLLPQDADSEVSA